MINASFTPVHLVRDSGRIIAGQIAAGEAADRWTFEGPRLLKGENAISPRVALAIGNAQEAAEARALLSGGGDALLFEGKYWGTEPGLLLVNGTWMSLKRAGENRWWIIGPAEQMSKTYPGAADKLVEMVNYILHDEKPEVPVSAGFRWKQRLRVGKVTGGITGMAALGSGPAAATRLFVASPGGDRMFVLGAGEAAFADITAGLDTASRAFAFLDLNADGRPDLVSWDGMRLRTLSGRENGGFAAVETPPERNFAGDCGTLSPLSASADGGPGLLVGGSWPCLLRWEGRGWSSRALPGKPAGWADAGAEFPCIAADWDGDGYPDVLQLRDEQSLLWRGSGRGFESPRLCAIRRGGGPARWCLGDFDTDGRLDLFVSGTQGSELWENIGDGTFRPVARDAGSLRLKRPAGAVCLSTDMNHDGRPDLAVIGRTGRFFYHFNRGYRCFGEEGELGLELGGTPDPSPTAPVHAVTGDFNGDGAVDLVGAAGTGEIFCFINDLPKPRGLWIGLPPRQTGPVAVSVWQGGRYPVCVGTYLVEGDSRPVYASLRQPGPCTLKWRWAGGAQRTMEVKDGLRSVVLGVRTP